MKAEELKKMDTAALKEMASAKRGEIVKMRLDFSRKGEKGNIRLIRQAKKDLARLLTTITQKDNE